MEFPVEIFSHRQYLISFLGWPSWSSEKTLKCQPFCFISKSKITFHRKQILHFLFQSTKSKILFCVELFDCTIVFFGFQGRDTEIRHFDEFAIDIGLTGNKCCISLQLQAWLFLSTSPSNVFFCGDMVQWELSSFFHGFRISSVGNCHENVVFLIFLEGCLQPRPQSKIALL